MAEVASETAYYLNRTRWVLALIGRGVPFPPGHWIRIAGASVQAWHAEELVADLFPRMRERPPRFFVLLTAFDVQELERTL